MSTPCVPTAALAGLLLVSAAHAHDATTHEADLTIGTLIGGEDFVLDVRSNAPSSLCGVFFGLSGSSTIPGGALPAFGLDVSTAALLILPTDGVGRLRLDVPTTPGFYGPVVGLPIWFEAVVPRPDGGFKTLTGAKAAMIEPPAVFPGFLVDEAATRLPPGSDTLGAFSVRHGDVDRDGDEDLVLLAGLDVLLWLNDGAGSFSAASGRFDDYVPHELGSVELVDVDQDNDLDVILAGGFDDTETIADELWLNDGAGFYERSLDFPAGDGQTETFEFGDFDGDGDLDFVRATGPETHLAATGGKDRLFLSDGQGEYVEDTLFRDASWNEPDFPTTVIRAGDLDNDGDLDLFVGRQDTGALDGTPGQPNAVLVNDGVGGFTDQSALLLPGAPSDNTQDATLADLDLDGDLDVIVANSHASVPASQSGELYVNQGGDQAGTVGVLAEVTTSDLDITTPADWIRLRVVAEDMDADGDLDVLMSVHDLFSGAAQLLFLNQGGAQGGVPGALVREFWFDPGDFISYGLSAFDMDDDGDQDLLQTASGVVSGNPAQGDALRLFVNTRL